MRMGGARGAGEGGKEGTVVVAAGRAKGMGSGLSGGGSWVDEGLWRGG